MGKCVKNSFQTTAYLQLKKIKQEKQFSDSESVKQSVKHAVKKERNINFLKCKTR